MVTTDSLKCDSLRNHIEFYEREMILMKRICSHKHKNGKLAIKKDEEPIHLHIEDNLQVDLQKCSLCGGNIKGVVYKKDVDETAKAIREQILKDHIKSIEAGFDEMYPPEPVFVANLHLNLNDCSGFGMR